MLASGLNKPGNLMGIDNQQFIEKIVQLAEQNDDIEVLWLYGSRAKGQYTTHSDFDLAIAYKDFSLPPLDKYTRPHAQALDWALILSLPENRVSIVDINRVPVYLAFNIVEYGKVIYKQGTPRVYLEQDRIYSQFEYQQLEEKYSG